MRALRIIMGYRNSTPLNVILTEARKPSLFYRFRYLGLNFFSKTRTLWNHQLGNVFRDLRNKLENRIHLYSASTPFVEGYNLLSPVEDLLPLRRIPLCYPTNYAALFFSPEVDVVSGYEIDSVKNCIDTFYNLFESEINSTECLFTDGSVSRGSPSSGYSIVHLNGEILRKRRTAGFVSSYCVESMALLDALEIVRVKGWKKVTIFSDSRSCLSAVSNQCFSHQKSYIILDIKNLVMELKNRGYEIKMIWIPSHRGIPGNELADRTAKLASVDGQLTEIGIPLREVRNMWSEITIRESRIWCQNESRSRGSYYFAFFNHENPLPWFNSLKLRRRTIISINRLRSGHTSLKASLFRFLMVDSPECAYCGEDETPEHVFWVCSKYIDQQTRLRIELASIIGHGPYLLETLLSVSLVDVAFALEDFICSIPVYIYNIDTDTKMIMYCLNQ